MRRARSSSTRPRTKPTRILRRVASTPLVYAPSIPLLLGVLAIAQMGIHIIFFFHISSAPDQTNNFLSLAFGIFVVGLTVFGSMIIMANLNHMMPSMEKLMEMQR